MKSIAIYARVSGDRQVREATVDSQVAELRARCALDGVTVVDDHLFVDDGYPGGHV